MPRKALDRIYFIELPALDRLSLVSFALSAIMARRL